jgi:predicted transcriptional regulator
MATRLNNRRQSARAVLPELKEIRERRVRLHLSQRDLAKKMKISQSGIAKIESGKVNPSYLLIKDIFSYLESIRMSNIGKVSDVASRQVASVQRADTVAKAMQLLQSTGYKQLPVRDGDMWVGCLFERTISRHIVETNDPRYILRRQVGQIMDESLPTVAEDTPIPIVIPLLQQSQAVLTTKSGRVTGIVTNTDLLKVIRGG